MRNRSPAPESAFDGDAQDPAIRVLRRFRIVFNAVRTHFQQVESHLGLGGAQAWALSVIARRPGIGVTELAREMDIHQSTASNLVRQLSARALIAAATDANDRRAVQLTTLPPGRRLLKQWDGPFAGVLPRALSQLDGATLVRLDKDLGHLIELLDTDERAAGRPLADM